MTSMSRRMFVATLLPLMAVGLASATRAPSDPPANSSANLTDPRPTSQVPAEAGVAVIAGNGRTLMPGLIDAHWHAMLIRPTPVQSINGDVGYNNIAAGAEATDTLMRGFTKIRDMGGPIFGLKSAVDA